MLIDFSDVLQTNVYVLGGVFLQLCRLMRLEQHPLMQRPIDPSLFIHRFADKMNLGKRVHSVSNTALRLVASMKRDWMQTGRRPAGICGAALWVASHVHGFDRSKSDVVSIVHIGEQTLKKRITEFSSTPAALLSVEEFDAQAQKYENDDFIGSKEQQDLICSGSTTLTCKHRDDDNMPEHFQHGMCRACYIDYVKVSGGTTFLGGMDPPAFTAAQKKRDMEQLQPRILRIANFEAGQAEVQAEFEGALLEGEINEFAMIAGVVQSSAPAAGAANATAAAQTQIEERRPPQVIRQVQVQRVVLKEPPFKFMIEAEKVLKRIVGTKPAETHCLPFVHGKAKGCVLREHFRDDIGEFTKDIRLEIMHYLINLGCFDDGALEHLNTLYPSHDLILLGKEDFTPPENTVKIEVDNKAEKAKKEAAENIRKYKVNKEPPLPGTSFNDKIKKNEEALRKLNNPDVKKEEGKTENGVDTPTNDEEEMRDVCSDIEDEDINEYMNNQEQVNLKRVIWSEMNKDYLESQAAKEAASKDAAAR
jgi:transcription factor IIIB subunit 2